MEALVAVARGNIFTTIEEICQPSSVSLFFLGYSYLTIKEDDAPFLKQFFPVVTTVTGHNTRPITISEQISGVGGELTPTYHKGYNTLASLLLEELLCCKAIFPLAIK